MADQNGPARKEDEPRTDRNGYQEFAAHLAFLENGDLDVERLRWQGIPVKGPSDTPWEPIFVRSVNKDVRTKDFFEMIAPRDDEEPTLAFDPFVVDYAELTRRAGEPVEAILYRKVGAVRNDDPFVILAVGGLVTAEAVRFDRGGDDGQDLADDATATAEFGTGSQSMAKGHRVVLGIIDDCIPLLNARFWNGAGASRIVGFEAQSWGAPPTTLGQVEIANWLARLKKEGEDVLYRELAALFFPPLTRHSLRSRGSHGSHMLDLAGGTDQSPDDPLRDVKIRAVQLPPVVYDDTSGAKMPFYVISGLQRLIFDTVGTADTLVVNISLGVLAGSKDGRSFLEQMVAAQIAIAAFLHLRVIVVWPYGNDYAKQQVARRKLGPGDDAQFTLRVQPCDLTPSYVELRASRLGPGTDLEKLEITLRSPRGDVLGPVAIPAGGKGTLSNADGDDIAWVQHHAEQAMFPQPIPAYILISLRPTKELNATKPTAPGGAWTIHVENTGTAEMDFLLQVQSDDSPYPRRTGARQSYLDDPNVHEFNPRTRDYDFHGHGDIAHEGTNSAYTTISSAGAVTSGGAIVRHDPLNTPPYHIAPADYTSEGADWSGAQPDLSAVSGVARAPRGVRAAGVHSHATVSLDGTSAAAATITRHTVLDLLGHPLPVEAVTGPLPTSRLGRRVVLDNPAIRKRGV